MRAAALLAVMSLAAQSHAAAHVTRHEAKLRTFKALLTLTEQVPDTLDASHAAITVQGCSKTSYGWRCRGELDPVLDSGILTGPCQYVVRVSLRRTAVQAGACL